MHWNNLSPRDPGNLQQDDTSFSIKGDELHVRVWRSEVSSNKWLLSCRTIGQYAHTLKATDSRSAKIEAIEHVAQELEKAMTDLQKMKMVEP